MEIRPFDAAEPFYAGYVKQARLELLGGIGFEASPSTVEPLSYATYLGVFDGGAIVGFSESYRYDEAFGSYERNPFAPYCDLSTVCPPRHMAHIRTAYVAPSHRRVTRCFAGLYLTTARHFLAKGAAYTTMSTTEDPYLHTLYTKLGAQELCRIPGFAGQRATVVLYLADLCALLEHPFSVRRAWQCPPADEVSVPA